MYDHEQLYMGTKLMPSLWRHSQKQNRTKITLKIQQKLPKVNSIGSFDDQPKFQNPPLKKIFLRIFKKIQKYPTQIPIGPTR